MQTEYDVTIDVQEYQGAFYASAFIGTRIDPQWLVECKAEKIGDAVFNAVAALIYRIEQSKQPKAKEWFDLVSLETPYTASDVLYAGIQRANIANGKEMLADEYHSLIISAIVCGLIN